MRTLVRRLALVAVALAASAGVCAAQQRGLVSNMGACAVASPRLYVVVDGASSTDCSVGLSTVQVLCLCANGSWAAVGAASSPRQVSFRNPPASAGAYDCEFSGALCSGWALDTASTAIDSGTVSPVSTASGNPLADYASWPGWLLFQSDESTTTAYGVTRTGVSLATSATIFAHVTATLRDMAANEGQSLIALTNSTDSNEAIYLGLMTNGSAHLVATLLVNNNGSVTGPALAWPSDLSYPGGSPYFLLVKNSNTYHGFVATADLGALSYLGSVSKTGVTTFDTLRYYTNTANDSPRIVSGVDFVRYYASATFALANP